MKKPVLISFVALLLSNLFILMIYNQRDQERINSEFSIENKELKLQNSNLNHELKEIRN
jgi:hypothetical protein